MGVEWGIVIGAAGLLLAVAAIIWAGGKYQQTLLDLKEDIREMKIPERFEAIKKEVMEQKVYEHELRHEIRDQLHKSEMKAAVHREKISGQIGEIQRILKVNGRQSDDGQT